MPLPPHVNEDDVWLYGLEGSRCQFSECRLADSVRARLDFFRISNPSASVATRKDRLDPNSGDGRQVVNGALLSHFLTLSAIAKGRVGHPMPQPAHRKGETGGLAS